MSAKQKAWINGNAVDPAHAYVVAGDRLRFVWPGEAGGEVLVTEDGQENVRALIVINGKGNDDADTNSETSR